MKIFLWQIIKSSLCGGCVYRVNHQSGKLLIDFRLIYPPKSGEVGVDWTFSAPSDIGLFSVSEQSPLIMAQY